jgi:hypothetical protein
MSLFALTAGCIPPGLPAAPTKDADNGAPTDYGWFEGGKTWQGDFGDPHILRVAGTYYACQC